MGRQPGRVRRQQQVLDGGPHRVPVLDLERPGVGARDVDDGDDHGGPAWAGPLDLDPHLQVVGFGVLPPCALPHRLPEVLERLAGEDDEPPRLGEMVIGSPHRGLQQRHHLRPRGVAVAELRHTLAGVDGLESFQGLPPAIAAPARGSTFQAIL